LQVVALRKVNSRVHRPAFFPYGAAFKLCAQSWQELSPDYTADWWQLMIAH
jgi:hypothetical protein